MYKIFVIAGLLLHSFSPAQQTTLPSNITITQANPLLGSEFWKKKPSLETLKAQIATGYSASAQNENQFDVVTLAIINDAPFEHIVYLLDQPGNPITKPTHHDRTYLHWAAAKNRIDLLYELLKRGSSLSTEDTNGKTPFQYGLIGGMQKEGIDFFASRGENLHTLDNDGVNVLMLAVARDSEHLETTNYLISKGLNPKATDKAGRTFVDYAARFGNLKLVQALIAAGYPYTSQILPMALQGGRTAAPLEVFTYLVEDLKIPASTPSPEGKTALHFLPSKEKTESQIAWFLSKGVNPDAKDKDGNTALHAAAKGRSNETLDLILKASKASLNAPNANGATPLMLAAEYANPEIFKKLIDAGAKINVADSKGNRLIWYLTEAYIPKRKESLTQIAEKIKILSSVGLNFAELNAQGNTFLHLAVAKDSPELSLYALELVPSQINSKNDSGLTPLMQSAMMAKSDAVLKILLNKGARKDIKNELNETALSLAQENEQLTKIDLSFLK